MVLLPSAGLARAAGSRNDRRSPLLNQQVATFILPALWPVAVLFACGRPRRNDWALALAAVAVPAAYFAYWFQYMCYGPRFAYESIPFWLLLVGRGLTAPVASARAAPRRARGSLRRLVAIAGIVWGLVAVWPGWLAQYSRSYWGVDRNLVRAVEAAGLDNAVVMVREETCGTWYFGAGMWANDPALSGPVVYARDLGSRAAAPLFTAFPGRRFFVAACGPVPLVEVTMNPGPPGPTTGLKAPPN
jgi:hypothetical protein